MSKQFRKCFRIQATDLADRKPIEDPEDIDVIKDIITDEIEDEYLGIVGRALGGRLTLEPCFIADQKNAGSSMFITPGGDGTPGVIRLSVESGSDWGNIILQLGRELFRYLCWYANGKEESPLDEETETLICEAAGNFYLRYFADKWHDLSRARDRFPADEEHDKLLEDFYGEIDGEFYYFEPDYLPTLEEFIRTRLEENSEARELSELLSPEELAALALCRRFAGEDGKPDKEKFKEVFPDSRAADFICR